MAQSYEMEVKEKEEKKEKERQEKEEKKARDKKAREEKAKAEKEKRGITPLFPFSIKTFNQRSVAECCTMVKKFQKRNLNQLY